MDRLCQELFLSAGARERDDNLLFVRERLLRSEADLSGLLDLCLKMHHGKRVPDDETNPLVSVLRLSGIVRSAKGTLVGRNRIYERVFDPEWVRANLPDAEVRRQRAAFRKGVMRTAVLAAVVLAAVAGLAVSARNQAWRAEQALYGADMNMAMQALEVNNLGHARSVLEKYRPSRSGFMWQIFRRDPRGWEWRYLAKLCRSDEIGVIDSHLPEVNNITVSPDGRTLAASSIATNRVELHNLSVPGNFELLPLPKAASAMAYSPDGTLLAAGSDDGIVVWNLATRQPLQTLTNGQPREKFGSIRFSPDGLILADSSGLDVKLWELKTGQLFASLTSGRVGFWKGIGYSSDGKTLAYALSDGPIVLWDMASRIPVGRLTGHTRRAMALQFTRDGKTLISSGDDGDNSVKVWNVPERRLITNIATFRSWVGSLALSRDERFFAAGSADQRIKLFEMGTWKEAATLKGHLDEIWSIAFSLDGAALFSGSKDGTIRIWSGTPRPADEGYLPAPPDVETVQFSLEGRAFLIFHTNGAVDIHTTQDLKQLGKPFPSIGLMGTPVLSPDGESLAKVDTNGVLHVWNSRTQEEKTRFQVLNSSSSSLSFSPDGQLLAIMGDHGLLELWDLAARRRVGALKTHQDSGRIWISRDRSTLAVCEGNTPEIWSIPRQEKIRELVGHTSGVNGIALTQDGKLAATASWDGTFRLWQVETGKQLASFHGQLRGYRCVAISPDEQRVAAAGSDGTIELWDLRTRQAVLTIKGHRGHIFRLAFLPDNNTLISAGYDGVRRWSAPPLEEFDAGDSSRVR